MDKEKVIKGLKCLAQRQVPTANPCSKCGYSNRPNYAVCVKDITSDTLALLKEHEEKRITLHKKHIITWNQNDQFSVRNLYEAICETLLDEGELFISRTDNHEKDEFVFYVVEGR